MSPHVFSAARLALNALAGVIPARRPSLYPVRHSTSFAGRSQERSKLGTAGLFARASCASGPGVKRPCQERPADCLSWAWSMWRTVVVATANYHALETCTNLTRMAPEHTQSFQPDGRTLALEEFDSALDSCGQYPTNEVSLNPQLCDCRA
jgi:hypothetical protein